MLSCKRDQITFKDRRHLFNQIAQFACRPCPIADLQQGQSTLAALLCRQPGSELCADLRQSEINFITLARGFDRQHPVKCFRILCCNAEIFCCFSRRTRQHRCPMCPKAGPCPQHIRGSFQISKGPEKTAGQFISFSPPGRQAACPIPHKGFFCIFGNCLTGGAHSLVIHTENKIGMGNLAAQMGFFCCGQIAEI